MQDEKERERRIYHLVAPPVLSNGPWPTIMPSRAEKTVIPQQQPAAHSMVARSAIGILYRANRHIKHVLPSGPGLEVTPWLG